MFIVFAMCMYSSLVYQWEFSLKRQCLLFREYLQPLDARKFHDQFDQGYNQATSLSQHYGQESEIKLNDKSLEAMKVLLR